MKQKLTSVIALCAIAGAASPALADCKQELSDLREQIQTGSSDGISKDGSLAPLESTDDSAEGMDTADTASASDSSDKAEGENEITKDGDTAPLEADVDSIATSGQQAAAQQDGDASEGMSQELKDALEVADAALEAGDDVACMKAVKEARNTM